MRGYPSISSTFATSLINSLMQEHECSILFITAFKLFTIKIAFSWCKNVKILPSFTQRYNGHHLGDNCIQIFFFWGGGEVYRRIYGRKFSFTVTRKRSRKR